MPMMNEQTYKLVVTNIRRYSMWLSVADPDWLQETLSCLGGDCTRGIVPSLLLMVDFPRGGYPQGQLLSLPRFRLHQAARLLAAQDPAFRVRLVMLEIDRHDVDRIIQTATYGLIQPQLSDDWLSSPFFLR